MFETSTYLTILVSVAVSLAYSLLAWRLSSEPFSETKFLRTTAVSALMALGFGVSGTPLGTVYVSPFAATLISTLCSKYLNTLNPTTIQQTQPVVDAALKAATPTTALSSEPVNQPEPQPTQP